METTTIVCDTCGNQLNRPSGSPRRYIEIISRLGPIALSGVVNAVMTAPAPERHFCDYNCLRRWLGEETGEEEVRR